VEAVEKSYHISINKDSMEVQVYELSKALGGLTILLKGIALLSSFSDRFNLITCVSRGK
jgi:hypothetical protein